MNDVFYRRMLALLFVALVVVFVLASVAHAEPDATQERSVAVSLSDVRELVTYSAALESENRQLKLSLDSERSAVDKMLADFEAERKATAAYARTLEDVNQSSAAEIKRLNRHNTTRNYIIAVLTAAVVTLAVTH